MQVYDLEDIILRELRENATRIKVCDGDVGRVEFEGTINIGRIAEQIWQKRLQMVSIYD
jgi:hypothetical protein